MLSGDGCESDKKGSTCDQERLLNLMKWMNSIVRKNKKAYRAYLKLLSEELRSFILNSFKLNVSVVPSSIVSTLIGRDQLCLSVDSSCCVLAPSRIFRLLGLNNGEWVRMIFDAKSTLVKVIVLKDLDDFKAIISDVHLHNLKQSGIIPLEQENITVSISKLGTPPEKSSNKNYFVPYTATVLKYAVIETFHEVEANVVNECIDMYFSTSKYLVRGDIFEIDLQNIAYFLNSYVTPSVEKLYFEVVDIIGPENKEASPDCDRYGFIVERGETAFSPQANTKNFLPGVKSCARYEKKHLTAKNFVSYVMDLCPSGLDAVYKEIKNSFKPFFELANLKQRTKVKPIFLLYGPEGAGKREIVNCVGKEMGLNLCEVNCRALQSSISHQAEDLIKNICLKVKRCSPCILLLRNIELLCRDHEKKEDVRVIVTLHEQIVNLFSGQFPVFVVGTCDTNSLDPSSIILPRVFWLFLNVIHFPPPTEEQRGLLINWLLSREELCTEISAQYLVKHTSGFAYGNLEALIASAKKNQYIRLQMKSEECEDRELLKKEDFDKALETMLADYSQNIGAPKIPEVSWDDVGGLATVKKEILSAIMLPLKHPGSTATGLRKSGILLYGPPGTGKTLLAKAVATDCKLNFLSVKGPELLNKYIGQSEENVRDVFEKARAALPCIIFFDELDSLAPARGNKGDSSGVMDRVISQLLTEMDGLDKCPQLFIMGATNRPDLLDPALLRPGRFDKLLFIGAYEDRESQLSVMKAVTRKFKFKENTDLATIVGEFPEHVTGADVYLLCSNAWMSAAEAVIEQHTRDGVPFPEEIRVSEDDFKQALSIHRPSVSEEDIHYFKNIFKETKSNTEISM